MWAHLLLKYRFVISPCPALCVVLLGWQPDVVVVISVIFVWCYV